MEVTKDNFHSVLPSILSDINSALFIAIDTEFSALLTEKEYQRSSFDGPSHLYAKELHNLKYVSILQVGISIYKVSSHNNTYIANTYNFYVRPHAILCINENILFQASVLEFLELFNFSKWSNSGIPYLNAEDEEKVRLYYAQILSRDLKVDIPWEVRDNLLELKTWTQNSKVGDSREVNFKTNTEILLFLAALYSSGLNLCPSFQNDTVHVTVTPYVEEAVIKDAAEKTLDIILGQTKGFVKVFEALCKPCVPLIVHNGLKDLMLLYKHFHRSLPESYKEFKMNLHRLFPHIYDTKHLASVVKRTSKLNKDKVSGPISERFLFTTNLASVKKDLETMRVVLHRPTLKHSPTTPEYNNETTFYHEAGYDAYTTGYCFLHLSHIYTSLCQFEKPEYQRPLSPRELIHATQQWKNEIPIGGIGIEYVVLDGMDPKLSLSRWWVVESRNIFTPVHLRSLVSSMADFGGGQAIKLSRFSALIAPYRSSKFNVKKTFNDYKHIKITRYTRHSKPNVILWSWALLSTCFSSWFLIKSFQKQNCCSTDLCNKK